MHSRAFGVAAAFAAFVAAAVFFFTGHSEPLNTLTSTILPSANLWFPNATADFLAGMCGVVASIVIMLLLNKVYNVFRAVTSLFMALFSFMMLSTPDLMTQFYTGTLLAIVVPACVLLLFSCYRQPGSMRSVFLIFFLLSLGSTTQYCFIFYLPAFLIGLGQMRILSLRAVPAAAMGIVTPWWILAAAGVVDAHSLVLPSFASIFAEIDTEETLLLLIAIGLTTVLMLLCYTLNLFKTIAYNARSRAISAMFVLVALTTLIAMSADYRNIISYVPLLNFSAAMEVTHYFSTHRADKSFIAITLILVAYAAIFTCQTII